ncbi:MAG: glycosyltransferase family 4 protein [Planctomycetota bacterium]
MQDDTGQQPKRIGFVATRISGNDGVSLEIHKWSEVLERLGHTCFYIAGESDQPADRSQVISEAHFKHPVIQEINRQSFGQQRRNRSLSAEIHEMTWVIKEKLHSAIDRFQLDLIIAENCLTIPMNVPLGLAVVGLVMETRIGCIAHHHDFVWERERFLVNAVDDHLVAAFPPALPQIQHVVINSQAAREFSRRTGLPCRVIPNVMDFDHPPQPPDEYTRDFRETLGLGPDDFVLLQPTRVVQRKGIEHSIELVRQLDHHQCKLVIAHASGDEGDEYSERVVKYAKLMGVEVIFAAPWIAHRRGTGPQGRKQYTIWDAYQKADLITYPSTYEGFGNAFLEAVYYRKPILSNRYAIYRTDIEPCGFKAILMEGFLTDDVVDQVRRVLLDKNCCREIADHNYELGARFFSYGRVEDELRAILAKPGMSPRQEDA